MTRMPRRLIAVLLATPALLLATAAVAFGQTDQPWTDQSLPPDERAELLAGAMSLEQKLRLFLANPSPPSPELGIPSRKEKDGCCGVSLRDELETPTTGLPKSVSLASTFNRGLANRYGFQIGQEAWNTGFAGVSAPTADLIRSPHFGRQGESFGEDPLLGGRLPAAVAQGVQRQEGVYAGQALHRQLPGDRALLHQPDHRRARAARALRPPVGEIIVKRGNPGAVMCAFQQVNDEYACASRHLLIDILKEGWNFPGWVSSDFNACPDLGAVELGTDVCAPNLATLAGVACRRRSRTARSRKRGSMTWSTGSCARSSRAGSTTAASRHARHAVPGPPGGQVPEALLDEGEQLSRTVARQGAVLLKNEDRALPVRAGESVAVRAPTPTATSTCSGARRCPTRRA